MRVEAPDVLVVRIAQTLRPGKALDLACGSGRNAIWLAEGGWNVTAVGASARAIATLREQAPGVDARIADLGKDEFMIQPASWDLLLIIRPLPRDLFEPANLAVKPEGGLYAMVVP